jgi:hypothetical protein
LGNLKAHRSGCRLDSHIELDSTMERILAPHLGAKRANSGEHWTGNGLALPSASLSVQGWAVSKDIAMEAMSDSETEYERVALTAPRKGCWTGTGMARQKGERKGLR